MQTEPITIDGLAGPVVVDTKTFWGRSTVFVGGVPVQGTRRGDYQLPTAAGGTVPAKLRANAFDAYPTIEIDGGKHQTGPATPLVLKAIALLPLGMIIVGGVIGGAFGGLAVGDNFVIVRTPRSTPVKIALMLLVLVAVVVAFAVVAAVITTGFG